MNDFSGGAKSSKCRKAVVGWDGSYYVDAFRDGWRTNQIARLRTELTRFAPSHKRDCFLRFVWLTLGTSVRMTLGCFGRERALLVLCSILVSGCHSGTSGPRPTIEFRRVPPPPGGSPDKLDIIEGRVTGALPGQQIVLYARTGTWWVQPLMNEPFTKLNPDSTWTNTTHVGTEYAALLVEPGYRPSASMSELPSLGGGVVALATARAGGAVSVASKTIMFSGYEWRVRDAPSNRGGENNYEPSNAWTDADGALHLRIAKVAGQWTCAEVSLTRNLGYGTYSFVVRDTSHLEPAAVFSMFTWDYAGADPNHREMDIEISWWGDPTGKNAQYVVQPFYVPENTFRFNLPAGVLTHSFHWEAGRATFRTFRGTEKDTNSRPIAEHVFTSGVPSPGVESARINLYIFRNAKVPIQNENEVVIEKFEFLP